MKIFADILFPSLCAGCETLSKTAFCTSCNEGLRRIGRPMCRRCGSPSIESSSCRDCRGRTLYFDVARQAVEFDATVRRAIHRFKYKGERVLAKGLAELAAEACPSNASAIAWVPSSRQHVRERGFDHSAILARNLGQITGLPCVDVVKRKVEVAPQVSLSPGERRLNLHSTFECCLPAPLEVIVIDDVFTTGASLSEAARALKAKGAERVTAVAIARTLPAR